MAISDSELTASAARLKIFDVDQNAWEQEPNGLEANVRHVHYHLSRDLSRKDFTNAGQVTSEIAPDALAYGLRVMRWAGAREIELQPGDAQINQVSSYSEYLVSMPNHFIAWFIASSQIADALHGIDHLGEAEVAREDLPTRTLRAAEMLIHCANLQAEQYEFDLSDALTRRLNELRVRFGIQLPAVVDK